MLHKERKCQIPLNSVILNIHVNRKMIRTFPNLKVEDKNGNMVYFDSLLKEIKPYYLKVHEPKKLSLQANKK